MAFTVPPPNRTRYSQLIRAMAARSDIYFPSCSSDSLKTTVSRIRKEYKGKRDYTSAKERDGVRVWRLT